MTRGATGPLTIATVMAFASTATTFWLVGDLSETANGNLTYVVDPPNIPTGLGSAIGIGSLIVGVVAAVATLHASTKGSWDPGWRWVVTMVAGAGTVTGFSSRVLTAGVAGANQGAGLTVLLGGPTVLGLLGAAAVRSFRLSRR